MATYENSELNRFYQNTHQELKNLQIIREEGGSLEELFTEWAVDLLAEAGETENVRVAYDEKALGTKNQHKINAYSISDNYETIDLFITVFRGTNEPAKILKDEIDTASKRIANFFRKGIYKDYVNEIEESSPIFDFAHTLSNSQEIKTGLVRVNALILTDGLYSGAIPTSIEIHGFPFFFRIIDIEYLYNVSEKSHIPIEIDFEAEGYNVPCIESSTINEEYQSYLAIIPGAALATMYERFGSRLLEQNVRSFLQFTGKINKGIRNTILNEPHMFLAFNNGLAATAEEIEIKNLHGGKFIKKIKDFQIVNGGQTTASIFHTFKKDKADISEINVQVKFSVIKNRNNFSEIVSRISEYANTQNKVSVSDLSSNRPFHIALEKLSRSLVTPHIPGKTNQTKWFYERARGQYKNARIKDGFTKTRQKAFDLMNPRNQLFTKEELAKFQNSYHEIVDGKKIVVGPHFVVRGGQKNYVQFINYNEVKNPDNIYFEDTIAKAILFRSAEKIYGVKPNAIGDMRYITVPYSIAYFGYLSNYKLDLYKIWKNQAISEQLTNLLNELMVKVEGFIKSNAPGSLYGEWAKKEECWNALKNSSIVVNLELITDDFINPKSQTIRRKITDSDSENQQIQEEIEKIKSIPYKIWDKIEQWGLVSEKLTQQQRNTALTLSGRIRNHSRISEYERITGLKIIDTVIENAPELLFEIDEISTKTINGEKENEIEITLDLVKKMVDWDRKNKKLKDHYFIFMNNVVLGKYPLNDRAKSFALTSYNFIKKFGFKAE